MNKYSMLLWCSKGIVLLSLWYLWLKSYHERLASQLPTIQSSAAETEQNTYRTTRQSFTPMYSVHNPHTARGCWMGVAIQPIIQLAPHPLPFLLRCNMTRNQHGVLSGLSNCLWHPSACILSQWHKQLAQEIARKWLKTDCVFILEWNNYTIWNFRYNQICGIKIFYNFDEKDVICKMDTKYVVTNEKIFNNSIRKIEFYRCFKMFC